MCELSAYLVGQLLLEIAVDLGAFRHDDEGVRVYTTDDVEKAFDFVLGDHGHEDIGLLLGKGAFTAPVRNATLHLYQNGVRNRWILGENHGLHIDVLDEHPVQEDGQNRAVDQGVDDHLDVENEEADGIDKGVHDNVENTDFSVRMANRHTDAEDVAATARGSATHDHTRAAAGHDATHEARGECVMNQWGGRRRNNGQGDGTDGNGNEGFDTEVTSHDLICQDEERGINQEIDDAHEVDSGWDRHVKNVQAEQSKQLSHSHESAVVQSDGVDDDIDTQGEDDITANHPRVLFDKTSFLLRNQITHCVTPVLSFLLALR